MKRTNVELHRYAPGYIVTRQGTGRPRRLDEATIDYMVDAYNKGDTQQQLADRYNVSISTVRKYLKERRPNIEK